MELTSLLIIAIVLVYLTKNNRGKQVLNNFGDAAVEVSAATKSAATALHRQCDELLSDSEAEALKAEVMAEMAEEAKTAKPKAAKKAKKYVEDLDDAE